MKINLGKNTIGDNKKNVPKSERLRNEYTRP